MTAACPACAAAPLALETAQAQTVTPRFWLSLPTIHCAVCIGKVERAVGAMPGVETARVNLSLKRLSVYGSETLKSDDVVQVLAGVGYEAHPLEAAALDTTQDDAGRALLMRMAVAGFAMMNVMLLSVAVWSGATDATRDLFHLISAAISLPVVAYSAQPFFRTAMSALRVGQLNMDVPISLAIILAAAMSLYESLNGGDHAYFDAALSLTFFLLIGRYLDHITRRAARSAARELTALEVHTAERLTAGKTQTVNVSELAVGDAILVPTGVRIPVDAKLTSPLARLDRSFLTGESAAVVLERGGLLQAGEINLGAPIEISATAVGNDTTLRRMASLVETAENGRNSYTALADRVARVYAPVVHLLALVAFLGWFVTTGDARHAMNVAIAVLIITCPCALGLAVPAVSTAAIGQLFAKGFLVKHATALERLSGITRVVFDKTGTLTLPGTGAGLSALATEDAAVALGLAQTSAHPVSRSIVAEGGGITPAALTDVREVPGSGVEGRLGDLPVRLGKGQWLGADFSGTGLRIGDRPAMPIETAETLRPGVMQMIAELQADNLDLELMTGDRPDAAQPVADALHLTHVTAGITAEDKHARLLELEQQGEVVLMVGDGLNDTAALAAAHASIAPASALDASRSAADIVVLRDSFADIPFVLRLARMTRDLSVQNCWIAAVYNLIAVPIALAGYATPLVAALAMSTSSITVLLNAQRVRRLK